MVLYIVAFFYPFWQYDGWLVEIGRILSITRSTKEIRVLLELVIDGGNVELDHYF